MDPEGEPDLDPEFPSGEWVGYWLEPFHGGGPERFRQDMALTFHQGLLTGAGDDSVGPFRIAGRYDTESKEVWWTKQYLGAHSVYYRGFREIRGIWGTWDLDGWGGGFHIWPRAEGELDAEEEEAETDQPQVVQQPIAGERAPNVVNAPATAERPEDPRSLPS